MASRQPPGAAPLHEKAQRDHHPSARARNYRPPPLPSGRRSCETCPPNHPQNPQAPKAPAPPNPRGRRGIRLRQNPRWRHCLAGGHARSPCPSCARIHPRNRCGCSVGSERLRRFSAASALATLVAGCAPLGRQPLRHGRLCPLLWFAWGLALCVQSAPRSPSHELRTRRDDEA